MSGDERPATAGEACEAAYYDGGSCEACGEFHAELFLAALAQLGYAVVPSPAGQEVPQNVEN